jgi:hypothetical protein
MTTLHERRHSDPAPTPQADRSRWLLVLGVVVVVGVLAAVLALLLRGHQGDDLPASSTLRGSGVAASETRTLPPFVALDLAGSNSVTVRVGAPQSVVVHADDNLLGRVTTHVQAGNLVIGTRPGSFTTRSPMRVDVTVPSLGAMTLTGSGVVVATGIDAVNLTVVLAGSGLLRLSGTALRLDVNLGGSGDAQLERLVAKDVHAVVSGSGRILVTATDSLDASVPGSGVVVYSGNPAHVTTSVTGSGAVTRA